MASSHKQRIYRSRNPVKVVVLILLAVVLVLVVTATSIFFGFKKYLVYTPDGVELQIPWLEEYTEEPAEK